MIEKSYCDVFTVVNRENRTAVTASGGFTWRYPLPAEASAVVADFVDDDPRRIDSVGHVAPDQDGEVCSRRGTRDERAALHRQAEATPDRAGCNVVLEHLARITRGADPHASARRCCAISERLVR